MSVVTDGLNRAESTTITKLRANCQGTLPLDARLEPWMVELLDGRVRELAAAMRDLGSPLNVLSTEPFARNIAQLDRTAADRDLEFQVFFARKANKCLAFVEAAGRVGSGVDVASEQECQQALDLGTPGSRIICTAAIKTVGLIELCVRRGVTIAIDNRDEMQRVQQVAAAFRLPASAAIRVSGFEFQGKKLPSRFGFDIDHVPQLVNRELDDRSTHPIQVKGLHFHLDGYCADQRVAGIRQCLPLVDLLRASGHDVQFLDIGGGLPMSYLPSESQWDAFWKGHRSALLGRREPLTYGNHGLGLLRIGDEIHGRRNVYPYFQTPVRAEWLANVLDAHVPGGGNVASSLRGRSLQLRCEPGRSILDGCGLTIARVEFTKQLQQRGGGFVGVAMNRTQCRTSSDDFLVDPLVVRCGGQGKERKSPTRGFLVGAYCTESELISLRQLCFPHGIEVGDLVVLPNTAGYFMHFLESRSHQFPLATNILFDGNSSTPFQVDRIDSRKVELQE